MCELLGVSAAAAVRLDGIFAEFRAHAVDHPDGWGIAWWDGDHPTVVKEARSAHRSVRADRIASEHPASRTFVVHIRAASVGALTVDNTHPFVESSAGRTWVFAHNGTVEDLAALDPGRFVARGATDSERAFHHLLTRLERSGVATDDAQAAQVWATARALSSGANRVNFLLSDGRRLFAWYDGHRSMHLLERATPGGPVVILASTPVSADPGWTALPPGTFLEVGDGVVVRRVDPDDGIGHDAGARNPGGAR